MTQDEHLLPVRAGRDADARLADLAQSKPYAKYEKYGGNVNEINLRDYLFVVLKRKWLIISLVLIITSLATVQAYREPNIFEGATTIKIGQRPPSVLQGAQIIINAETDPNFWGTQLKLLQSPSLARQVVLSLNLQNNPKFLGGQAQSSVFASLKRIFSRQKTTSRNSNSNSDTETIGESEMRERQFTAEELAALEPYEDAIIGNEIVEAIEKTNLVTIHYRHTDPELSQKIADELADVFVQNNVERMESGTSKAGLQLAEEIARVQDKVHKEQQAQFTYAKEKGLPLPGETGTSVEQQRLSTYSQQLLAAENDRRNLTATYEAAKESDPFSNPEVLKDERIIKLRERISELKDKRTALLARYTEEWPEVKQVEEQIKSLQDELDKAPPEVLRSMKSKADAAAAHEKSLLAAYSKQHGVTTEQTKNQIEMAAMAQELTSDQQYLNTLLQKRRELAAINGEGGTNVTVSNHSRLPHEPVGPARVRSIVIAFVLSLVAGIGLAFLLDFLDDTVKSLDDVDRYIRLPALALIPSANTEKPGLLATKGADAGPTETTALVLAGDSRSPIAESYRHLRTSLLLSCAGTPPKTILVTSGQPSEGKTTTAVNTAFMLAQTGAEILIIDCDLRRPRLHTHFNLPNTRGLTSYLSGEKDLDKLIQTYDKLPNLKVLTCGAVPPNPAELLGSEEMRRLLSSLSERFAHIIVDSPPAISFTDASILSTFVDGVMLVVHSGRSSRAVVRRAKQQLLDVGANIFGVVLNNVKSDSRDPYYSAYYTSAYYYADDEDAAAESAQSASG